MTAKTLLMALGVGVVVGLLLGILFVGLISGNREQAALTPPSRTVTVEETVETTVERTVPVPATPDTTTPATATPTATATAYP